MNGTANHNRRDDAIRAFQRFLGATSGGHVFGEGILEPIAHSGELLDSLEITSNSTSRLDAAQRLYVDVRTLHRRLDRVHEETGLDASLPGERCLLDIAMSLRPKS